MNYNKEEDVMDKNNSEGEGFTENKDVEKDWVFLTKVANDIEFGMIAGLLEMGEIPAIKKVVGVDGFLQVILGSPIGGIDVLVPKDKLEEALQLINSQIVEEEEEDEIEIED